MPTPNIPHVLTANTFDQWRIRTNSLINAANELRGTTYEKEAGLLYLSNTQISTALLVSGNATVADTLTVGTLLATRANITSNLITGNANVIGTLTAANAFITHNLTAGNVSITGKLSLPGMNDVAETISNAANTVRMSVNNSSTISSSQLNFVNSSTVTISISPGSGISSGNANVEFTVIGGGGGGGGAQGAPGAPGAPGAQGAPGTPGTGGGGSGAQGPQGVQGATGTTGAQGAQGRQGATGPSTAVNATNDLSNNPLYPVMVAIDGSNQTPKVSKSKLSFNANDGTLTALKFVGDGTGITGITGTPGAQGSTGAAGAQGAPGAAGAQGSTGAAGAQGATGVGSPGAQGAAGSPGAQGATGPSTAVNATNDLSNNPLYPVMVAIDGSNQTPKVSKAKLSFNANDGTLTALKFVGDGTGITGVAVQRTAGDTGTGALTYNGTTRSAGVLYGGTTNPASTTRVNYDGALYVYSLSAINDITAFVSDDRLKDKLYNIDNALSIIENLNGFYFKFNDNAKSLGYGKDERMVGVSAQEVQKVMPEVVAKAPISDEYLTVQYEKLVPLLIEAIKELKKEVDDIKKRL